MGKLYKNQLRDLELISASSGLLGPLRASLPEPNGLDSVKTTGKMRRLLLHVMGLLRSHEPERRTIETPRPATVPQLPQPAEQTKPELRHSDIARKFRLKSIRAFGSSLDYRTTNRVLLMSMRQHMDKRAILPVTDRDTSVHVEPRLPSTEQNLQNSSKALTKSEEAKLQDKPDNDYDDDDDDHDDDSEYEMCNSKVIRI